MHQNDYNSPELALLPGFGHLSKSPVIDPCLPVRLIPVHIPKPWGQEIWYTGMEQRGESKVVSGGEEMPLSIYLADNPTALTDDTPVLLLKVLDPDAVEVTGDLYLEVHEHKQEVYVVTHIDAAAWPDSVGGIRFGMCQEKRSTYASPAAFRTAYLESVQHYETIRRALDERGVTLDPQLEREARARMDSFVAMRELRVRDVVQVPTWTPHALQHGVRVVEFQTPTYERFIISFAQRVLTQDHWDSAHAIARMHIDEPAAETIEHIAAGVECIARFDDFNVWRVDLNTAAPLLLPKQIPYAVCMCLSGQVRLGSLTLCAEQACLVPHAAMTQISLNGDGQLLIAAPKL